MQNNDILSKFSLYFIFDIHSLTLRDAKKKVTMHAKFMIQCI